MLPKEFRPRCSFLLIAKLIIKPDHSVSAHFFIFAYEAKPQPIHKISVRKPGEALPLRADQLVTRTTSQGGGVRRDELGLGSLNREGIRTLTKEKAGLG